MIIILLSNLLYLIFGYCQTYAEIRFDELEVNSKKKFPNKHVYGWWMRFILGLALQIPFFFIYPPKTAAILTLVNGVALMPLTVFWFSSLYQHFIKQLYGVGNGFTSNSKTPMKDENSFQDRKFEDTFSNRLLCLGIWAVLTISEILYLIA